MEEKEKNNKKAKKSKNNKKQKHQHPNDQTAKTTTTTSDQLSFRPSSEVKGLRFGGQFIVKSFTIRRASPFELLKLLSFPFPSDYSHNNSNNNNNNNNKIPFPSTVAFLPTNFTILAHHAWHTLTLGLGTTKSKVVVFVFDSEPMKAQWADLRWPTQLPLGEANRRLVRGLPRTEMARFKFRKGCITFYVYAVRTEGSLGFSRAEDLRAVLQSVVDLKDFLDHTAMLALPSQRSIAFSTVSPATMAH